MEGVELGLIMGEVLGFGIAEEYEVGPIIMLGAADGACGSDCSGSCCCGCGGSEG